MEGREEGAGEGRESEVVQAQEWGVFVMQGRERGVQCLGERGAVLWGPGGRRRLAGGAAHCVGGSTQHGGASQPAGQQAGRSGRARCLLGGSSLGGAAPGGSSLAAAAPEGRGSVPEATAPLAF